MSKFAKEKEMLPIVMDWLRPQFTAIETELWCGYAGEYVPDIVGIKFEPRIVKSLRKRVTPRSRGEIAKMIREKRLPQCMHDDMIAIELKLRNFVEAYFQARIYQSFGFRTFIAMPEGSMTKVKAIRYKTLIYDGIGFIEVGDKCVVRLPANPPIKVSREEEMQISDRLICRFMQEST